MTYEERVRHRDLVERASRLGETLGEGEDWAPITRAEARELVAVVEEILVQLSPERWDRMMEAVADEAARRAGAMGGVK